jgi:hypothetical protein
LVFKFVLLFLRAFLFAWLPVELNPGELLKLSLLRFYFFLHCFHGLTLLAELLGEQLSEGVVPFKLQLLQFPTEILNDFLEVVGDGLDLLQKHLHLVGLASGLGRRYRGYTSARWQMDTLRDFVVALLTSIGLLVAASAEDASVIRLVSSTAGKGKQFFWSGNHTVIATVETEFVELGTGVGVAALETGVEGVV